MLQAWETYYLLIGTSAAALVGVMFIVATLTAEIAVDQIDRGTIVYQSPIVFHLSVIATVSALALVPEHLLVVAALLLIAAGVAGLVYAGVTLRRIAEPYDFYQPTIWDHLFFGVLPGLSYLLMLAGGASVFWVPELAAETVGAATLLLLLVSIRNAWDVATFAVRMARAVAAKEKAPGKEKK
jgi:hypothetical protein